MKLAAGQITSFLARPPDGVRVFLFYGPNAGLAHERAENLAGKIVKDKNDPFAVTALAGAALGSDAARLHDEVAAGVFGGGRRLVRIHQAAETNAAALARFLAAPPAGDGVLLIEAGDLDKRSKLRALCEGDTPLAAAIPCYMEDAAARLRLIGDTLAEGGLSPTREALRLLAEVLPLDRLAVRGELEKLALFARDKKAIDVEDVRAIIADAGGAEIDDLIEAAASGDGAKTALLLDRLAAEQTSSVALFRALQRHLMRLHLARSRMDQEGLSASAALKTLSPPVFWKAVESMTRQLGRWPLARLEARLAQLLDAESAAKRTGTPETALCAHLFLSLATKP